MKLTLIWINHAGERQEEEYPSMTSAFYRRMDALHLLCVPFILKCEKAYK